ncbi:MAG: SprT-like domain-containing protein [Fibrobacter sp.]|nr:SprT-like domain-containing protein [Fibrobacter sp.]
MNFNESESIQMDLFGASPTPAVVEKPKVPNTVSLNGLVAFKYSAYMKKSIRCRGGVLFGHPEVMLPAYMKSDEFVQARELAAEWAEYATRRKTQKNRLITKELVSRFWTLVDQILADKGEAPLATRNKLPPMKPKGKYHNLEEILAAVNNTYFENKLSCRITWSNRVGGLSFHSVRKDPVTGEDFNLISISKGYDAANCPEYAVAGVVYHECLHIAIPPVVRNGRRIVHGRNFRKQERLYLYYAEWSKWHREVLPKNIRDMRRHKEL